MTGKFVPSQTTDGRERRKRRGNTQKMKFFETAEFYFRVGSYKFSLWYRGEEGGNAHLSVNTKETAEKKIFAFLPPFYTFLSFLKITHPIFPFPCVIARNNPSKHKEKEKENLSAFFWSSISGHISKKNLKAFLLVLDVIRDAR